MCELFKKLNVPFNKNEYEYDDQNRNMYVNGQVVTERLNSVLGVGFWKYKPIEIEKYSRSGRENKVIDSVRVLLEFSFYNNDLKEWITFVDSGCQDLNQKMLEGDAIKSAITDAMKKCASRIGVASDLYKGLIKHENNKIIFPDSYYEFWGEQNPYKEHSAQILKEKPKVSSNIEGYFTLMQINKFKAMVNKAPEIEELIKKEFDVTSSSQFPKAYANKIFKRIQELKGIC